MRSRLLSLSVAALLSSLLAACGGGPNDDDLHAAMNRSVETSMTQAAAGAGDNPQIKAMLDQQRHDMGAMIDQMHIVSCQSADAGGYRCDVSYGGHVKNLRMVKDKGAWSVVED